MLLPAPISLPPVIRPQFDQGRSRCDGTVIELQMLIATYTSFSQSHSQARAAFAAYAMSCCVNAAALQLLLMLQREAALVDDMRAAAAEFRKVPPTIHALASL